MRVLYLAVVVALTAVGCGGDGSTTAASTVPVAVSGGLTFQSVSHGGLQSCGLTTTGAAYCWGRPDLSGNAFLLRVAVRVISSADAHPTLAVLVALAMLVSVVGAGWLLLKRWRLRRLRRRESASAG